MKRFLLLILLVVVSSAACGEHVLYSDDTGQEKQLSTKELRDILKSLDTSGDRDGIQYGNETRPHRIQEKGEVDYPTREELIENNRKAPIVDRIEQNLYGDVEAYKKGTKADEKIEVIVQFVDDLQLPRISEPDDSQPQDSEYNSKVRETAEQVMKIVGEIRQREVTARLAELPELGDAEVVSIQDLTFSVNLKMMLSKVEYLASQPDVQYISYNLQEVGPPPTLLE